LLFERSLTVARFVRCLLPLGLSWSSDNRGTKLTDFQNTYTPSSICNGTRALSMSVTEDGCAPASWKFVLLDHDGEGERGRPKWLCRMNCRILKSCSMLTGEFQFRISCQFASREVMVKAVRRPACLPHSLMQRLTVIHLNHRNAES
jgi:hypothetical protein